MIDRTKLSVRTYDAVARMFDARYCRTLYFKKELQSFVRRLPKNARILDAGCGSGPVAAYLASRGFDVVGVDLSSSMLAIARERAPDVEFIQHDIRALDLPARSFDAIVCTFVLIHISRSQARSVIRKFSSLLKQH